MRGMRCARGGRRSRAAPQAELAAPRRQARGSAPGERAAGCPRGVSLAALKRVQDVARGAPPRAALRARPPGGAPCAPGYHGAPPAARRGARRPGARPPAHLAFPRCRSRRARTCTRLAGRLSRRGGAIFAAPCRGPPPGASTGAAGVALGRGERAGGAGSACRCPQTQRTPQTQRAARSAVPAARAARARGAREGVLLPGGLNAAHASPCRRAGPPGVRSGAPLAAELLCLSAKRSRSLARASQRI